MPLPSVAPDLLHRPGDHVADLGVAVGGDRADLRNLLLGVDLAAESVEEPDDAVDGGPDAAADSGDTRARRDEAQALVVDRLGQHRGRGRAVAGDVTGLGRRFLEKLRAQVLVRIAELDLFGHAHAVLGDGGVAPPFVDDRGAAAGSEGRADGLRHLPDPDPQVLPGLVLECELLRHPTSS
jgi:hypothetical protein